MMRAPAWVQFVPTVLAGIACGGPPSYPTSASHPLLGQALPELAHRRTLDGQPFDVSQLDGKPVLVKFFAAYCEPCKKTLPAAEALHEAHPEVVFIGIDEDDSAEAAATVVQTFGLTFPVLHDSGNVLSGRFRVNTMPMTFVADRSRTIRWVGDERQTPEDLKASVRASAP